MFLVKQANWRPPSDNYDDPYTHDGACIILTRFASSAQEMLLLMNENRLQYEAGYTALSSSPLRKKVWVAAAMKTAGLINEVDLGNGRACMLCLSKTTVSNFDLIMTRLEEAKFGRRFISIPPVGD